MGAFKKDLDEMYMDKAQELTEQEYGEDWDFYDLAEIDRLRIFSRAIELVHENLMEQAERIRESKYLNGGQNNDPETKQQARMGV